MKNFTFKDLKYLEIIIAVLTGYILLKVIDNISAVFSCLTRLYNIISPFVFALIIAYMLNPLVKFIEKKFNLKRGLSILATYLIVLGILALSSLYIFPKLYYSILDIINNIPTISKTLQQWFNDFLQNEHIQNLMTSGVINVDTNLVIPKISTIAMSSLNMLISTTLSFTNYFIKLIFGFLIAIYVLFDKERICEFFLKLIYVILKEKRANILMDIGRNLNTMIGNYIGIKAIDSLIIGILAFIGLSIIGSEYVLLLTVIVGVTNMIPYLGALVCIVLSFLINVFVSPVLAVIVAGYLFALHQFDAWFLDPKLVGGKVGLTPLAVLFGVVLGGGFYGILGMLLASPVMSVIKLYLTRFLDSYEFSFLDNKK